MAVVTGSARHLLGGCVSRSQRPSAFAREQRGVAGAAFFFEQLGNAKVQQLHLAVIPHQHVGGLDVAVDDQVGMGVGHGGQHIEKEADARLHVELVFVAILVDVHAVDIFEDEIGLPVRGDARIEQFARYEDA